MKQNVRAKACLLYTSSSEYTFTRNETETGVSLTVTAYVGKARSIAIPAEIDGVPVTAIGDRAFAERTDLASVVIPEGVVSIGAQAFSGCAQLRSVSLPETLTNIGEGAFALSLIHI